MIDGLSSEELRILSLPIGELSPDEVVVLNNVFVRMGFSPPIIIK